MPTEVWLEMSAADGRLRARMIAGDETQEFDLAFYRDNYVVGLDGDGQPSPMPSEFRAGPGRPHRLVQS